MLLGPLIPPGSPARLLVLLGLFLKLLFQVHLHVSLLLVTPRELPAASITTERFLARVGPFVGR